MKNNIILYLFCVVCCVSFASCDKDSDEDIAPIRIYTLVEYPNSSNSLKLPAIKGESKKDSLLISSDRPYTIESSNEMVISESSFEIKKAGLYGEDILYFSANDFGKTILTVKNDRGHIGQIEIEVEPLRKKYVIIHKLTVTHTIAGTVQQDEIDKYLEKNSLNDGGDLMIFNFHTKYAGEVVSFDAEENVQRYKGSFEIINPEGAHTTQKILMTYNGRVHQLELSDGDFLEAEADDESDSLLLSEDYTADYNSLHPNNPVESIGYTITIIRRR